MHRLFLSLTTLFLLTGAIAPALAGADVHQHQTAAERSAAKAQLRLAFETRIPQLQALKDAAKAGETTKGLLAITPGTTLDPADSALIDAENTDRQALYQILADETGATPELVAERAARRNIEKAKSGEKIQKKDGTWVAK